MRRRLALVLLCVAAPVAAQPRTPVGPAVNETRWFSLALLTGARLGWAREHLVIGTGEIRLEREEHVLVQRGRDNPPLAVVTRTTLTGDPTGAPLALSVRSDSGGTRRSLEGVRARGGWRMTARDLTGATRSWSTGDAVPRGWLAVLARLGRLPRRPEVLLEDRQGARAALTIARAGDQLTLTMITRFGELAERWTVDAAGRVLSAEDDSFRARAVPEADATRAAPPLELVDSLAIPIAGAPAELDDRFRLAVSGLPAPIAAPGQRVVATRGDARVLELSTPDPSQPGRGPAAATRADLSATFYEPSDAPAVRVLAHAAPAGSAWARAAWLSHQVYETLTQKDTFTAPLTATEALASRRGDCTAHAVVLGALLKAVQIPSRLATGYIVDQGALHRHRWVLAYIDGAWVPLDPLYDEAPARAGHLALAIHGSSPEELVSDDLVFAGVHAPSARWLGGRENDHAENP